MSVANNCENVASDITRGLGVGVVGSGDSCFAGLKMVAFYDDFDGSHNDLR